MSKRNLVRLPLAGLVLAAAGAVSACALPPLPADPGPPPAEPQETWSPSAEWLDLQARDREALDLMDEIFGDDPAAYDRYREAKRELEDYFIQHPDADTTCEIRMRWAPPELQCDDAEWMAELQLPTTEL